MDSHGFPRFFIFRPENFAWLTGGGDNTVMIGEGVGWLEVGEKVRLHTPRIEAARLVEEEAGELGVVAYPWYTFPSPQSPSDLEHDLTPLRLVLSESEQERFRTLGKDASRALGEVLREAKPSWSELELAGAASEALYAKGIQPVVLLAAGEERASKYRHPLPKDRPLGRLCMAVICGRRDGLIANLTRMRSWRHPTVRELYRKVLHVEAAALEASRPGAPLDELLETIRQAYVEIGHPEAFQQHHQGGIAGYRPREVLAVPGEKAHLEVGMSLAWNPSLPGAKVEDTFLLTPAGLENLTVDPEWPLVEIKGRKRPALWEI